MRLQKSPAGLLGAFELKVEGQNPPEFSNAIAGIADVYDQYLALNQRIDRQRITISNPGTSNAATHAVPQAKCWRVLAVSVTGVLDAADAALTTYLQTRVSSDAANTVVGLIPPNGLLAIGGSANRLRSAVHYLERPLFLPSGWAIITVMQLSATPAVSFIFDSALVVQEFDA